MKWGNHFRLQGRMLWGKGDAACGLSRGAGCWRRICNARGAVCQGRGGDALKPPFVWEEKGSLWLVTVETEWGFSRLLGRAPPSSHAVRRPGCHRSQGDPGTGCDRREALPSPTPRPTHPTDAAGPIRGWVMVPTCDRGAGAKGLCWVVKGGLSGICVFRLLLRNIYG